MGTPDHEPWLTRREVAQELRVSPSTIDRLHLPHLRVGTMHRYKMSEVLAHLRGGQVPEGKA